MSFRPFILVTGFALTLGLNQGFAQKTAADDPKPPPGWKVHSPGDGTYVVWIPEKPMRQSERTRTTSLKGAQFKINALMLQMGGGGPSYVVEEVILSAALAKQFKKTDLEDMFRDMTASEVGGKISEETEVKTDAINGSANGKEYRIEGTKANGRARIFVTNTRVFLLRVAGTKDQVDGDNAKLFLESGRLTAATKVNTARGPRIQGGGNNPEFKDAAPEGGLLVGLEVGLGKFVDNDIVKAVRPVYRVGDKDSLGEQQGTDLKNVVKVIAKPGYAVGGITVKNGLTIDGLSIKFMKVVDGKLDPKDSYESDWVGGKGGGNPVKIGGDGASVVGLIGKANAKDVLGLGLAYKEADKPTEKK